MYNILDENHWYRTFYVVSVGFFVRQNVLVIPAYSCARVIRFGEFSPFGRYFTLDNFPLQKVAKKLG
jgi:hypothetical protein